AGRRREARRPRGLLREQGGRGAGGERLGRGEHRLDARLAVLQRPHPFVPVAPGEGTLEGGDRLLSSGPALPLPPDAVGQADRSAQRLPELRLQGPDGQMAAVTAAIDAVAGEGAG